MSYLLLIIFYIWYIFNAWWNIFLAMYLRNEAVCCSCFHALMKTEVRLGEFEFLLDNSPKGTKVFISA
jgi:hypothetical protein